MDYLKQNLVVFGDNLQVLSRLEDESFDLVYLDPPWNFDGFNFQKTNTEKEYQEFIFKVIQQSHRLLKEDGNLVLYSNPSLNVNFHNLLKPVFDFSNFKAEIIIPRKVSLPTEFGNKHDTLLFYSKSENSKFYPFIERTEKEIKERFPLLENNRRYRLESLVKPGTFSSLQFEWRGFSPGKGMMWRFNEKRLNELENEGEIYYKEDLILPRRKKFFDDNSQKLLDSVWSDINPYQRDEVTGAIIHSSRLLERIIKISSAENDIILDPFAGSGKLGDVARKLDRKWVGIEKFQNAFTVPKAIIRRIQEEKFNKENNIVWEDYLSFNLSKAEQLREKISKGENSRLEFKEAYIFNDYNSEIDKTIPGKIIKEIAGFLNSKYGGTLLLGVKDKGEIRGLEKDYEVSNPQKKNFDGFELSISDKIRNALGTEALEFIEFGMIEIDGKEICEVIIKPSFYPIFLHKKEFIVRQGSKAQSMDNFEMFEILKNRNLVKL